jgi:hypothetical protein
MPAMKKTKHPVLTFIAKLVAVIALLICASWWSGKHLATFGYKDISPKGYYRLELWEASSWSFQSWDKEVPAFVRLYDNRSGKLMGESDILEMIGNGEIFWPVDTVPTVGVGNQISFPAEPEPE